MTVGSQVKTCYATLKSIEAGLDLLYAASMEQDLKAAIEEASQLIKETRHDIHQQVIHIDKQEPQYKS
ncbi:hypothetical protein J18TS1_13000 [Oceanobacillus oncorhynchi subsp. incaldanensis]|uniref:DUF1657 domain-containing protein n=2 Tax=Oceanobacillus TaxID=182709 RepID=A0A0A1MY72_9BACI|nr:DUF1657 domain-containing protein [Oceanobacillus oncorhynchi]MDM8100893.1 DUF1657 domain-containing protein [Oceanobacillus oncorhynchi]UUI38769.1 DUF1657 domain-containing protein [Oceanobacillus oncorhynchi]GIO18200.1 hypothetical protein J18TS1_13000 [Oceanobacillus oncorhynchi subsp. incaldanensis]CEI84474.1 hypothetical protein BN997_04423 [Oceanobacillus oncorhynchi]